MRQNLLHTPTNNRRKSDRSLGGGKDLHFFGPWTVIKQNLWRLRSRWFLYVCIVIVAEGIATSWPVLSGIDGQVRNIQILPLIFFRVIQSIGGIIIAAIALIPLVKAISAEYLFQRVMRASGIICAIFAVQVLVLTLTPSQIFLSNGPPTIVFLGFLVGAISRQPQFGLAWLDLALPDPPLIMATILMLVECRFTPRQIRPKIVFFGIIAWLLVEIIVRPLLLTTS